MEHCMWIGPEAQDASGRFALFRLDRVLPGGIELRVRLTASARYRLWVNGAPVLSGPCKGDLSRWYHDEVDLTPQLQEGLNRFAVQVLYHDPLLAGGCNEPHTAPISIVCPAGGHRLALSGCAGGEDLSTGIADWRVLVDESFRLVTDEASGLLGAVVEHIDFNRSPADWRTADCSHWPLARQIEPVAEQPYMRRHGLLPHYIVSPRPLPLPFEREEGFLQEIKSSSGLLQLGSLRVPPQQEAEILLDAGQVKVGYPRFDLSGGKGARIRYTWFEKFMRKDEVIRRDDWERSEVTGMTDSILLSGQPLRYEPFWPRTFRFLRIQVRTADEALSMQAPRFRRTGYPLARESALSSSAPWVGPLYDMCVETLQNCMLDTYMDCPYYEQLQYLMDTRLQVLFHLSLSNDDRLARRALQDFSLSMMPMGLMQGRAPSVYRQIISTFSLHFIFMVWELYRHTGDRSILTAYGPDCERILRYYEGCLSPRGLLGHPGWWAFVDWLPEWAQHSGTPSALQAGESTIISLMYAQALEAGAHIFSHSGRRDQADALLARQAAVCRAVQQHCWDEGRGLYREGPGYPQYTQHAQAWAVLNGIGGRRCLEQALRSPDVLRVTFATSYEWFRALEKAGLYAHALSALQPWIDLIALDCKTCPETPGLSRSENHAWSALPMYELLRGVAGIRQAGVGWEQLVIQPQLLDLPDLQGQAITPLGPVAFDFRPGRYRLQLPEGVSARFLHPDGRTLQLAAGDHSIE